METEQNFELPTHRESFEHMNTLHEAMKIWLVMPPRQFIQHVVFKDNMFSAFKSLVHYKFHLLSPQESFFRLSVSEKLLKNQDMKSNSLSKSTQEFTNILIPRSN